MGMSSRRAVLTMHVTALILGSLALIMLKSGPFLANSIAILTVVISGAALLIMEQRWNPEQPPPQGW
jgi:FtsH-binding integral membrane protein